MCPLCVSCVLTTSLWAIADMTCTLLLPKSWQANLSADTFLMNEGWYGSQLQ